MLTFTSYSTANWVFHTIIPGHILHHTIMSVTVVLHANEFICIVLVLINLVYNHLENSFLFFIPDHILSIPLFRCVVNIFHHFSNTNCLSIKKTESVRSFSLSKSMSICPSRLKSRPIWATIYFAKAYTPLPTLWNTSPCSVCLIFSLQCGFERVFFLFSII